MALKIEDPKPTQLQAGGIAGLSSGKHCAKEGEEGEESPCLTVSDVTTEEGDEEGAIVVATGILVNTIVIQNGSLSPQTDADMFVAKARSIQSLDWIVSYSAYTAYSALHFDEASTFGVGTKTSGIMVVPLSGDVVAVAGVFDSGTDQHCFVAKFRDRSEPPSIRFLVAHSNCTVTNLLEDPNNADHLIVTYSDSFGDSTDSF